MRKLIIILFLWNVCQGQALPKPGINFVGSSAPPIVYDTDAQAYLTAAGVPDNATVFFSATGQQITGHEIWLATDTMFIQMKDSSIYSKFIAIYPTLTTNGATSAKWNAVNPVDADASFRLTFVNSPTFTNFGPDWNGSSQYANTHINLSSSCTVTDFHQSYWTDESDNTASIDMGAGTSLSTLNQFATKYSTNTTSDLLYSGGTGRIDVAMSSAVGYTMATRVSTTSHTLFKNGVSYATNTATMSDVFPSLDLSIGAGGIGGPFQTFSVRRCLFATIGTGMSATDARKAYNIFFKFLTALHRI